MLHVHLSQQKWQQALAWPLNARHNDANDECMLDAMNRKILSLAMCVCVFAMRETVLCKVHLTISCAYLLVAQIEA